MKGSRGRWRASGLRRLGCVALAFGGIVAVVLVGAVGDETCSVSGTVVDQAGLPVAGAVVRQQTTPESTTTAGDGTFTLRGLAGGVQIVVTAWKESYYPGGVTVTPPAEGAMIALRLHPSEDNPDYIWYTSMPDPDEPLGCGHCMVAFPEWLQDAHSQSGVNRRFFSMYNGTDVTGTLRQGDGYVDDFPGTAGNCANCHAPLAAASNPFTADMNKLTGVDLEGISCEYCHKIAGVYLNPATGLPYDNAPGAISYALNRPPQDTHMFYGTFDDVTRRVSYLQVMKESQFCAPCHQFSFWGTPIYESFGEWLASPYAEEGIHCQACHMVPSGVEYFVFPEKGGLIRPGGIISSHLQPGAASVSLLQDTVDLELEVTTGSEGAITAQVLITNTKAGHHVPTDYPGRHMILVVSAMDEEGNELVLLDGPLLPFWCGDQSGLPGVAFAKVLRDVATGEFPVVNYWRQTLIESDNRIPAFESDASTYSFVVPPTARELRIRATLVFRRLFQGIAEAKGWGMPDILMEEVERSVLLGRDG